MNISGSPFLSEINLSQELLQILSDLFTSIGIAQPFDSFCFNLPNSLPAQAELASDLSKGAFSVALDSKPKTENLLLPWGKASQQLAGMIDQILLE